jgi:uncharacterized SAM-binding protein YcdF (DUF218 family)
MKYLSTPLFLLQYYLLTQTPSNTVTPFFKTVIKSGHDNQHYDAIIVPGAPYMDKKLALVFKARILWAKYLFDNGITDNIIFSGGAVYNQYIEGKVMKLYADSLHIPSEHTFSETKAEHSTENVYYSMLLAQQLGFKKVAIATDHFQAILIKKFMNKNCPDVELKLIDYEKIDLVLSFWPQIDPASAVADNFVGLPERENKIKRFGGTLGKHIVFANDTPVHEQPDTSSSWVDINRY